MAAINVIQIGLGPLGQKMAKFLLERKSALKIVGAVDVDPAKVGQDLGPVCGLADKVGVRVVASLKDLPRKAKPAVALLTTVSDMRRITPQVEELVARGMHVVSTCEELAYPWKTSPKLAKKIDAAAKKKRVAVLGTGVNPGYLMDFLPTALTAVCQRVDRVRVSRIQNAAFRRIPFQKKIGAGLTLAQFEQKRQEGTLRHVGLTESMHMLAARMGWKLDRTEDALSPIVAAETIKTEALTIEKGQAAGVQQIGKGYAGGQEKITLVFRASVGEKESHDTVEIFGEPNVVSTIAGGVNGDIATCAIVLNAAKQILRANPGLQTMTDLPAVSYFS